MEGSMDHVFLFSFGSAFTISFSWFIVFFLSVAAANNRFGDEERTVMHLVPAAAVSDRQSTVSSQFLKFIIGLVLTVS